MASADQTPIGSGFHAKSTAREVVSGTDLTGKRAVVTGGYSGIGLETVRALAEAGATVTVPARRPEIAREALSALPGNVTVAAMDLGDLDSVRSFANDYLSRAPSLDMLINNAGIMANPIARLGPGWESQFGTNHLGHFELARCLAPALKAADGARVIALSSTAHHLTDIHWDDPHFRNHDYDKWQAYGQAKTANSLFAVGLDQAWQGDGVRGFAVHPGGIFTPLQRHLPLEEMVALGWKNADGSIPEQVKAIFKTPEQGASTSVWAATSPTLDGKGGVYCEDADIAALATDPDARYSGVRAYAVDLEAAQRLWRMSEAMIDRA
ncbi:MAG: oxidoreductase [Pseudomonadota bacterium]